MVRLFAAQALALVTLLLAGCPVPIPPMGYDDRSRSNVPDSVPSFIVKGRTTRADVVLALGAPDAASGDAESFAYRSERHTGGVVFVVFAGTGAAGVGMQSYVERLLVVRFDGAGLVTDATIKERICRRGAAALGSAGGMAGPCLPLSDAAQLTSATGQRIAIEVFEGAAWAAGDEDPLGAGTVRHFQGRIAVLKDGLLAQEAEPGGGKATEREPVWIPFASVAHADDVRVGSGQATRITMRDGQIYAIAFAVPHPSADKPRADPELAARLTQRLRAGIAPSP